MFNETSAIGYLQLYTLNYTQDFYQKLSFRHRDQTTSYLQGEVAKKQHNIIPVPISKTTRRFYHGRGMLVPHSGCGLPLTTGLRSRTPTPRGDERGIGSLSVASARSRLPR